MLGIVDASPLIYCGKLGVLHLLVNSFNSIWTSPRIREEVLQEEGAPENPFLKDAFNSWIKVKEPSDTYMLKHSATLTIHIGEQGVLALAREFKIQNQDVVVIMDDLNAREYARILGIPVTGTIGILLSSVKQKRLTVDKCRELLKSLVTNTSFWLSGAQYAQILEKLEGLTEKSKLGL